MKRPAAGGNCRAPEAAELPEEVVGSGERIGAADIAAEDTAAPGMPAADTAATGIAVVDIAGADTVGPEAEPDPDAAPVGSLGVDS